MLSHVSSSFLESPRLPPSTSGPRDETPGDFMLLLATLVFLSGSSLPCCLAWRSVHPFSYHPACQVPADGHAPAYTRTRSRVLADTRAPSIHSQPPTSYSRTYATNTRTARTSVSASCVHLRATRLGTRSNTYRHPRALCAFLDTHTHASVRTCTHQQILYHRHALGPRWLPFLKNFAVMSERKSSNENQIQ